MHEKSKNCESRIMPNMHHTILHVKKITIKTRIVSVVVKIAYINTP